MSTINCVSRFISNAVGCLKQILRENIIPFAVNTCVQISLKPEVDRWPAKYRSLKYFTSKSILLMVAF